MERSNLRVTGKGKKYRVEMMLYGEWAGVRKTFTWPIRYLLCGSKDPYPPFFSSRYSGRFSTFRTARAACKFKLQIERWEDRRIRILAQEEIPWLPVSCKVECAKRKGTKDAEREQLPKEHEETDGGVVREAQG